MRQMHKSFQGVLLLVVVGLLLLPSFSSQARGESVTLVRDGKAVLPIVEGSVPEAAEELRAAIAKISGAELSKGEKGKPGVYVGLASDFELFKGVDPGAALGEEGFVIRSAGGNLYILGNGPLGVQHGVTTFLQMLGRRQFFPGEVWEVLPELKTIEGDYNVRDDGPDYRSQRRLWYGFGSYGKSKAEWETWMDRNRMGGPEPVGIGHTWYGINREEGFKTNPEWFALVVKDGQQVRSTSKPCYSHPEVIEQIKQYTLRSFESGERSVSLSPPDGLGYCQCELCREVFQGGEPYEAHGSIFAKRPDGVLVNITSETLFNAVNVAARAAAEKYPGRVIGCYAYSAYSHPTSFELEPNVYVQTTTSYRRTPLTLQEQLDAWGAKAKQVGIREYWSVYQWDWDNPQPGKMTPARQKQDIAFYHKNNVIAMNAEASNNWAPRGLGYYVAAQLLWDVNADTDELVRDFYIKAFGEKAAPAMERYYTRWYGQSVNVGLDPRSKDISPTPTGDEQDDSDELTGQTSVYNAKNLDATRQTILDAYADLDDAVANTQAGTPERARVDHLRMYAYYLYLRLKVWEADATAKDKLVDAVKAETIFGGRLTYTNMIHSRPLIGKAFHRRFKGQMNVLEQVADAQEWNKGWRVVGEPPTADELAKLWAASLADMQAAK